MNIKLIVGLGNIGTEYEHTRHNAGFWFADELAAQWKPATYMNLSGDAVAALARFYKIRPDEILVVHDELDIPCGQIRFKLGGGNGGHNGLKDIQAKLGTADFYRLRLGIGHPGDRNLVVGYVLNKPSAAERELIDQSIAKSLKAIPDIMAGRQEEAVRFLHSKQS